MSNDTNTNAPKLPPSTLEYNNQQSALEAGSKIRAKNESAAVNLKNAVPDKPKDPTIGDPTQLETGKPGKGEKPKTDYERQEQAIRDDIKNLDAERQKLAAAGKQLDAQEKELKTKLETQEREGKERSQEAKKAIAEIAKSLPEERKNQHSDALKGLLKNLPDKLTEQDVKDIINDARWDAAKASVGGKDFPNMSPAEQEVALERVKKMEESSRSNAESGLWGSAKKDINLPAETKWTDMTPAEQKLVQEKVAAAKREEPTKDTKKPETAPAAPAPAPTKDTKKPETAPAAPAPAPTKDTKKPETAPAAPAPAPTGDTKKPNTPETQLVIPPLPKKERGSSSGLPGGIDSINEALAYNYNLGVRPKVEYLFDSVNLKKGGPGVEHISDDSANVNMKVAGDCRVAYISPKSDGPQIESESFMNKNVKNYRNKVDFLRNSTDSDHANLTREMSPANLTPLFGDSPLTKKFSAQRNQKMSRAMSGGDNTERPGSIDIKDLAKAGAPIYSSADSQRFITELGNSAKIGKDGAMNLFGMRFGVPMYDSKRIQETGHSGTSTVHVDRDFKVGGTTVIPKDHYLQLDTGMIYDKSGNWVGEFEPDGKVFNAGLKVYINPSAYQHQQKAGQNATLL